VKPVTSFRLDQSAAMVWTKSGAMHEALIEHATGTVSNPLSDQQLREKFHGNAEPVLGAQRARTLADMIFRLDTLTDIGDLVRASA
jgi:hypothetical protein